MAEPVNDFDTAVFRIQAWIVGRECDLVAAIGLYRTVTDRRRRMDARRLQPHLPIRVDDPGAEADRADMPLAGGPQTDDEAGLAGSQSALVGMQHNRGIEQRRRLEAVFVAEIGADQQATHLIRHCGRGRHAVADLHETIGKGRAKVSVPAAELAHQACEFGLDPDFAQRPHPAGDARDAVRVGSMRYLRLGCRKERSNEHACGIGSQHDRQSAQNNVLGFHKITVACSSGWGDRAHPHIRCV